MVDVEALKQKLAEKKDEGMDFMEEPETPGHKDPKTIGQYIIIGVISALVVLFIISYFAFQSKEPTGPPTACFKHDVCVELEVMTTPEELERGLSGRDSIGADKGMLFIFERAEIQRMWMKDMKFSIDMMWIDTAGKIRHIEKRVLPCQGQTMCEVFEPNVNAKYVLEVREGFASDNNLFDGDKVELTNLG